MPTKKVSCIACEHGIPRRALGATASAVPVQALITQPPGCVCSECGHEQPTMDPCAKCRSVRVVRISVIRNLFGEDWRSAFDPKESP